MNSITRSIQVQGVWFKQAVETIVEHPINDVLDYFYSDRIDDIAKYLNEQRTQLTNALLEWLKNSRRLRYKETDGKIIFDREFFNENIGYYGNYDQFKRALKNDKFSISLLIHYHKILTDETLYYDPQT